MIDSAVDLLFNSLIYILIHVTIATWSYQFFAPPRLSHSLYQLHSAYVKVCQKRKLKFESESEFVDVCSMLQSRGVMSIKKAKERRLAKVLLHLLVGWVFSFT